MKIAKKLVDGLYEHKEVSGFDNFDKVRLLKFLRGVNISKDFGVFFPLPNFSDVKLNSDSFETFSLDGLIRNEMCGLNSGGESFVSDGLDYDVRRIILNACFEEDLVSRLKESNVPVSLVGNVKIYDSRDMLPESLLEIRPIIISPEENCSTELSIVDKFEDKFTIYNNYLFDSL